MMSLIPSALTSPEEMSQPKRSSALSPFEFGYQRSRWRWR